MPRLSLHLVALLLVPTWVAPVAAAPNPAGRCEADVELASAKFAQCRLTAESKFATDVDAAKLSVLLRLSGARTGSRGRSARRLVK